jgi:hypothetical protein
MILNSIFKDTVVVREDTEFVNCEFSGGTTPKQKGVSGVDVEGNASIKLSGCKFANKGYSAVYVNTSGTVEITGCEFDCTGLYNPIEGASSTSGAPLTKVKIEDNVMRGICGNNYINVYHFADNAVVDVNNVKVVGMKQESEVVRISNLNSNPATINVRNLSYAYDMSTPFSEMWTATFLAQDYSKDKTQNFKNINLNVSGLTLNGQKVTDKDSLPIGRLIVGCDNGSNEITDNLPKIAFSA